MKLPVSPSIFVFIEEVLMIYIRTHAYNAEKTIRRAIKSVLKQTFQDFIFYVCDNGSTDRTGKIIDFYAQKDSRIVSKGNSRILIRLAKIIHTIYMQRIYNLVIGYKPATTLRFVSISFSLYIKPSLNRLLY